MSVVHLSSLSGKAASTLLIITVEELAAHADVVDLLVMLVDHADGLGDLGVLRGVVLDVRPNALSVERVAARVHKELSIIKDSAEANVTVLGGINRDVSILHVTTLSSKLLRILGVLLNLAAQVFNLLFIIIQAVAQVLLHIAHLSFLREQVKQVFNFQNVVLSDNSQRLLYLDLLACSIWHLRPKEMLSDFHPELLASLGALRLVSIVSRHVCIVNLQGFLDSLRVGVHHTVEDDLGLFDHVDLLAMVATVLLLLTLKLLDLALAHVDSVINFEEDWLTLLLVSLFFLEALDQVFEVLTVDVEVKRHIVHSFCR